MAIGALGRIFFCHSHHYGTVKKCSKQIEGVISCNWVSPVINTMYGLSHFRKEYLYADFIKTYIFISFKVMYWTRGYSIQVHVVE